RHRKANPRGNRPPGGTARGGRFEGRGRPAHSGRYLTAHALAPVRPAYPFAIQQYSLNSMRNTRDTQLIFDLSRPGRQGAVLPPCDVPEQEVSQLLPGWALASEPPALPEVNEPQVIRHFVNLSQQNMSVDTH